jgi:general secretion pathway protein G
MKYKGFSFVELLVVLAILGLLGSLLLPAAARTLQASRRNTCQDNLKALGTAFRVYANENRGW